MLFQDRNVATFLNFGHFFHDFGCPKVEICIFLCFLGVGFLCVGVLGVEVLGVGVLGVGILGMGVLGVIVPCMRVATALTIDSAQLQKPFTA